MGSVVIISMKKIAILLIGVLLLSSCSRQSEETEPKDTRDICFVSESYSFSNADRIDCVSRSDEDYYIVTSSVDYTSDRNTYAAFKLSSDGLSEILETEDDRAVYAMTDHNKIILVTVSGIRVYDIESGDIFDSELINEINSDSGYNASGIYLDSRSQGFAMYRNGTLYLTDDEFNIISEYTVEEDASPRKNDFFLEREGNEYILAGIGSSTTYYQLDKDDGSLTIVMDLTEIDNAGLSYISDDYMIGDDNSIQRIDIGTGALQTCVYGDRILLEPAFKDDCEEQIYAFDDEHYAISRTYYDCPPELLIVEADATLDLSNREEIVLSGDRVSDDMILQYAIYLYNRSQNEYYITTKDYDIVGRTIEEMTVSRLEMITDFINNDTPDMFFGNSMDYNYMGDAGLCVDLSDYLTDENYSELQPCIRSTVMNGDGSNYQFYTGYSLQGFYGRGIDFPDNDISISDIRETDSSDRSVFGYIYAYELLQSAVCFDPDNIPDTDDLETMINYFNEEGIAYGEQIDGFYTEEDLYNGNIMLMNNLFLGNFRDFRIANSNCDGGLVFVGYPSVDGSLHVADPYGMVAVSSSSSHVDQCIDFIRILMSDEVQRRVVYQGYYPVTADILNEYLDYMQSPDMIPEGMAYYITLADQCRDLYGVESEDVSASEIESYREMIESVDTVALYDWGAFGIVQEEMSLTNKPTEDIAESLYSRLSLYAAENYT